MSLKIYTYILRGIDFHQFYKMLTNYLSDELKQKVIYILHLSPNLLW